MQPDAPGYFDEVFEDRDLCPQLGDCLRGRGEIDNLVCLFLELGAFLVGRFLVEVVEVVDRKRR